METYINEFESYNKKMVYHFTIGDGGIGDYIKYFMFILEECMKTKTRFYLKRNNIELEKYIQLNHTQMYTDCIDSYVTPQHFYSSYTNFSIPIKDVFHFTKEVKKNSSILFPHNIPYMSIHVRMGDAFLETEKKYVYCHNDVRQFSEEKLSELIEMNSTKNIFLCSDNSYKLKIKEKYPFLMITNCDIGHTSFSNTTKKQVLDAVTEFYILTNSEMIYGTRSGFSQMASKFNNIPYLQYHEWLF